MIAPLPAMGTIMSEERLRKRTEALMADVYDVIHEQAHHLLGRRAARMTLLDRTTELVDEGYMRVLRNNHAWHDKDHFIQVVIKAMRHVLVDHARRRQAQKRGGGDAASVRLDHEIDQLVVHLDGRTFDAIAIGEAVERIESADAEAAAIIERMWLGGLSRTEAPAVLGVTPGEVQRALALLKMVLGEDTDAAD